MRDTLNRHRIEVLLAVVVAIAAYYGLQGMLAMQDARAGYRAAVERQQDLQAEAAQYNVPALINQRDGLDATPVPSAFPTRDRAEEHLAAIVDLLIRESSIQLGPVVIGEIARDVTDEEIGGTGSGTRTYQSIDISFTVSGNATDLLDLAESLLDIVPDAALQDVALMLADAPGEPATLSLSVLLYYDE